MGLISKEYAQAADDLRNAIFDLDMLYEEAFADSDEYNDDLPYRTQFLEWKETYIPSVEMQNIQEEIDKRRAILRAIAKKDD